MPIVLEAVLLDREAIESGRPHVTNRDSRIQLELHIRGWKAGRYVVEPDLVCFFIFVLVRVTQIIERGFE